MSAPLFFVQGHRGGAHLWIGQWGLHLYWPDVWNSRGDRCPNWRQPS